MQLKQGEIFDVEGSIWLLVENFRNNIERYKSVHCAPICGNQLFRLDLDVSLVFQNSFVSLSLIKSLKKEALTKRIGTAHPEEVEHIQRNLITRFSYYTFVDLGRAGPDPALPDATSSIHPGTILNLKAEPVCIVDHWGCISDYPLVYVAPVVADPPEPTPLDVEISVEYQDLFSRRYFVRTDDFFLVERPTLENTSTSGVKMLTHGLVHKISRVMALKFGRLGLLL